MTDRAAPAADVIIAGTGIIGLTIALAALDKGMRVVIVGPGPAHTGVASSAAGAMLGVLGEVTVADTGPHSEADLLFRHASAQRWPALADRLNTRTVPITVRLGTAVIAIPRVKQLDTANLTAIAAAAQRLGARYEETTASEVAGIRPAPGFEAHAALFLHDEGYVDTAVVMPAVFQAVRGHKRAQYVPGWVREVRNDNDRVTGVVLTDGTMLHSSKVVIAAGAGSAKILQGLEEQAGRLPAILAGKGVSMVCEAGDVCPPYVVRSPNRDFACGVHMVPRSSGQLYVGATNRVSVTPGVVEGGPTGGEVHRLLHSACHELHTGLRVAVINRIDHGARPLTADGYPLIGSTELPGLLIATGTYRNGVLLAPAIADVISAELAGETVDEVLRHPFSPTDRSSASHPSEIRQIIDTGAADLVNTLLYPGGHLPYERQKELVSFIGGLLTIALTDDDAQAIGQRNRARALLRALPRNEALIHIFHQFHYPTPVFA